MAVTLLPSTRIFNSSPWRDNVAERDRSRRLHSGHETFRELLHLAEILAMSPRTTRRVLVDPC
jgi:hypothetical protein